MRRKRPKTNTERKRGSFLRNSTWAQKGYISAIKYLMILADNDIFILQQLCKLIIKYVLPRICLYISLHKLTIEIYMVHNIMVILYRFKICFNIILFSVVLAL